MKLYLYLLICAKERQNDKLETKAISYIQGVGGDIQQKNWSEGDIQQNSTEGDIQQKNWSELRNCQKLEKTKT